MRKNLLFLSFLISAIITANGQNLTLKVYKIVIDPADFALMNAAPKDEIYYPATFYYDTLVYPCQVKYKGSTSLNFPKRSFAIKFANENNIFQAERINLNADYKDHSFMRNMAIMAYFRSLGYASPLAHHVSFKINDQYAGVFTQVEQIDPDFLKRNNRPEVALYKAQNHGAGNLAMVKDEQYPTVWEEQAGNDRYHNLKAYLNKMMYCTRSDFDAQIGNLVDINNYLDFFAMHFVLCSFDNFTKNQYLNFNGNTSKYELIPWDNEGSFGNWAVDGYDSSFYKYLLKDAHTAEFNVAMQRLLENTTYRASFTGKVNTMINGGFNFMDSLFDNTYNQIKNDVYQDTAKECTNAQFDQELTRLKYFMNTRKTYLQSHSIPQRNPLSEFYVSNHFPTATDPNVTFRVRSAVAQNVRMYYADSVSFDQHGKPFLFKSLQLYDDGSHNDLLAGDLIYGNTLNTSILKSNLIPYAFTGAEQNYPANGLFYVDYYRSKTFAINKGNTDSSLSARVKFGKVYRKNGAIFLELINTSATRSSDISYCHIRGKNYYEDLMLRHNTVLGPKDTMIVSNDLLLASRLFPGKTIAKEDLYFNIDITDPLHLLSPNLDVVTVKTAAGSDSVVLPPVQHIVINEIQYNSSPTHETGDWVELYNPGTVAVDLTDWLFRDGDNAHNFFLPSGTIIYPDSYIVIMEDSTKFRTFHPILKNIRGNTGFGLSGSGEAVRLYNDLGILVDSVEYDDTAPWPTEADAGGPSLELKNYEWDNTQGKHWYAFTGAYGTPGRKNHIVTVGINRLSAENPFAIYPNPGDGLFTFKMNNTDEAGIQLSNQLGQMLISRQVKNGEQLDLRSFAAGIYYLRLTTAEGQYSQKLIIR